MSQVPFVATSVCSSYLFASRVGIGTAGCGEGALVLEPASDDMATYREKVKAPGEFFLSMSDDWKYFDRLIDCLTYDIVGFVERFEEAKRTEITTLLVNESIAGCAENAGATMPAERFLEKYKQPRSFVERDAKSRKRMTSDAKTEAFLSLP